jgi:hypothetical protein
LAQGAVHHAQDSQGNLFAGWLGNRAKLELTGPNWGACARMFRPVGGQWTREVFMKRQRGRSRRSSGGNNNPNRHFESNGPDVKIRGSAQQVLDKYLQYARDAQTAGDRVMSEAYFQHAEHYQRLLSAMQANQKPRRERDSDRDDSEGDDDNERSEAADKADSKSDGGEREDKPARRSRRKDDTSGNDPLKVIDGEGAEASGDDEAGDAGADDKPKRRRSYKKRTKDGEEASGETAGEGEDGVMKTISRGRAGRKKSSDTDESGSDSQDTQTSEAAAE